MNIYFLMMILSIIFIIITSFSSKNYNIKIKIANYLYNLELENLLLFILFFISFLILSFRNYNVGTDLRLYLIRFVEIGKTPFSELISLADHYSFEVLFTLLNKVVYLICPYPIIFMIITSFFSIFGFYQFIKLFSKDKLLSYYIYLSFTIFTNSMNTVRQFIAISILLIGIKYIIERKKFKFILLILITMGIHSTSSVFICLYPLFQLRKIDKKYMLTLIVIAIILYFFGNNILFFLFRNSSFSWYFNRDSGSGTTMLIFLFAVLLFIFYLKDAGMKIDSNFHLWIHMLSIAILINASAIHLGILERMMRYFIPSLLIILPNCLCAINRKNIQLICKCFFVCFFTLYFFYIMATPASSSNTNEYEHMNILHFNEEIILQHKQYYSY